MKCRLSVLVLVLLLAPPLACAAENKATEPLWHRSCETDREGRTSCIVEQFAVVMPQNAVAAHIRFARAGTPDRARMMLTVPLGVLLAAGVSLSIDGSKPIELPFERCTRAGCEASAVLDESALAKFARGETLVIRYASSATAAADIPIRLQGLADALKQLK